MKGMGMTGSAGCVRIRRIGGCTIGSHRAVRAGAKMHGLSGCAGTVALRNVPYVRYRFRKTGKGRGECAVRVHGRDGGCGLG